jgi:putative membrane protein
MGWWSLDPLPLAPVAIATIAYIKRTTTLRRRGRPVPAARQAWFATGIALLVIALVSPLDRLGEERVFYLHMGQHLLLGDLAPLAIVLGLDGPLLRPLLSLSALRPLRALAHPLVALPIWAVTLWGWHTPPLYQAALAHSGVHALEHLMFFTAGALAWAAVVEPVPGPRWMGNGQKAAYVLVMRTIGGTLGLVLIWSSHVFYPNYAHGERLAHIAPLTDQSIGGGLMFVEGGTLTVVVFCWLFLRWTREAEIRQRLIEDGVPYDDAGRAARYGRSAIARAAATAASSSASSRSASSRSPT